MAATTNDHGIVGDPECGTIWILTVETGKRDRLARPPGETCDRFPRWSQDGRIIVFQRSGKRVVVMTAAPSGNDLRPAPRLEPAAHRWTADCSQLFEYVTPVGAGWIVSDVRGRPRIVPALLERGGWRCAKRAHKAALRAAQTA